MSNGELRGNDRPALPLIPDHEALRRIGGGSYGEVWLVRNALGSLRAVKVVYRDLFDSDRPYHREFEGIRRFEPVSHARESQVDIFHVGINHEHGYFYYVMELADDAAAAENQSTATTTDSYVPLTLRRALQQRGPMPVTECARVGIALTQALDHLHNHGLVHRDIKPSNIIFVNGVPKLADIGLVTSIDATRSYVGTEGYISPEGPGTPQSDLYSLGKVLYEMATGSEGDSFPAIPETWRKRPDYSLLVELNEIIVKACDPNPARRHQTAAEMRKELVLLQRGHSIQRRRTWELVRGVALKAGLGLAALGLAVVVVRELIHRHEAPSGAVAAEKASIFVLPFRNLPNGRVTNTAARKGFSEATPTNNVGGAVEAGNALRARITDAFIDALGLIEGVRIGPRKSGWVVQREEDLRRLVRTNYQARYVLTGRARTPPERITLELTLYETVQDGVVWTGKFEGMTDELPGMQLGAIEQIASSLGLKVTALEREQIFRTLSNNLVAYHLVLQGLAYRNTGILQDLPKAVDYFHRALVVDPLYLDADSNATYVHRYLSLYRTPEEAWSLLGDRARRLLKVDDTHQGAHYALYAMAWGYERDWDRADRMHTEWMRHNQERAGTYWHWGFHHMVFGRTNLALQAWAEARRREPDIFDRQMPRSYLSVLGWILRDYDMGIRDSEKGVRLYPKHPWFRGQLGLNLMGKHRYDEAIEAIQKGRELGDQQWLICLEGCAHALKGDREKAMSIARELQSLSKAGYVQPALMARIYACLGDKEEAFRWLTRAVDDRSEYVVDAWWGSLITEPAWDTLRDDPRFMELRRRSGMEVWPRPWNGPPWVFGTSE